MAFSINRAANYTLVAAGQTASSISSGGTITVYGLVFTNTNSSAETSTVLDASSNTIMTVRVPANTTLELTTQWLADAGLAITTGANTTCTVFHSNSGS